MKSFASLFASTAALCALAAAAGAHAEQYEGVLQLQSTASRDSVRAQAVVAAHSPDPYADGANADVAAAPVHEAERAQVRAQARAAARAGNPYSDVAGDGVVHLAPSSVDRQAVRQQAIGAASQGGAGGVQ